MLIKGIPKRLLRILVPFLILLPVIGVAQTKTYVQKFGPLADSLSQEYQIPKAIILGVSILESSSGTSRNCKLLNNYFGIVGKNKLKETHGLHSRYKQYSDPTASFVHFCKVLAKKKFYKQLKGDMHYTKWTAAMSQHGYSEVPTVWRQRVNDTIRRNKLSTTP